MNYLKPEEVYYRVEITKKEKDAYQSYSENNLFNKEVKLCKNYPRGYYLEIFEFGKGTWIKEISVKDEKIAQKEAEKTLRKLIQDSK